MPLILTLLTIFNIFCLNKSDKKYDNNYQQSVFNYDTLYNDYLYYKLYDYLLNDAIKEYKFKKKTIFYSKNEYDSLYNDSVCYYIKNNDNLSFYEYRNDLGGYSPIDPASPLIIELEKKIVT